VQLIDAGHCARGTGVVQHRFRDFEAHAKTLEAGGDSPAQIVQRTARRPIENRIESPGDLEYLMGSGKAFELLLAEEGKAQVAGIGREIVKC
jgi:hypothetical protein